MSVLQMGITPMGDIISVLRHSKTVTDQAVRDDIMAENTRTRSVAKVAPAPPVAAPVAAKRASVTGEDN